LSCVYLLARGVPTISCRTALRIFLHVTLKPDSPHLGTLSLAHLAFTTHGIVVQAKKTKTANLGCKWTWLQASPPHPSSAPPTPLSPSPPPPLFPPPSKQSPSSRPPFLSEPNFWLQMDLVLSLGVPPERIILANCCKRPKDIRRAATAGVDLTTFDTVSELEKLARLHPGVSAVLRIRADDPSARCPLGNKYGAEPEMVAPLFEVRPSDDC